MVEARDAERSREHNNHAFEAMLEGRLDDARSGFEAAIELDADNVVALANLGHLLTQLGALDEAIGVLRRAVAADPGSAQAASNLGTALFHHGEPGAAVEHYRAALHCDADNATARRNLAIALHQSGDVEAAVEAYRDHLARAPVEADMHHNLGLALEELGRLVEAERALRAAVALEAGPRALTDLGSVLFMLERHAEAEEALEAARAADPDNWTAAYQLALALAARGKTLRATAELERLRERHPELAGIASALAVLYIAAGLFEPAVELLEEAVRGAGPEADAQLHYNLGIAHHGCGATAAARRAFERVVDLEADGSALRADAERWLERCEDG